MARARDPILQAWRTNCAVNARLVRAFPMPLWDQGLPGVSPRRTVRQVLVHLHNARSRWLKVLGEPLGIARPALLPLRTATRPQLLAALRESDRAMEALLARGLAEGGEVPATKAYTWRNLPLDVPHVLAYFVAHEAHHRGQLVMAARQLGARLPRAVTDGLWWWQPER